VVAAARVFAVTGSRLGQFWLFPKHFEHFLTFIHYVTSNKGQKRSADIAFVEIVYCYAQRNLNYIRTRGLIVAFVELTFLGESQMSPFLLSR
jgi:hypothetical protein